MTAPMECHIYRSKFKKGLYIYLSEKGNFDALPDDLRNQLGTLEFTFSMTLEDSKKLVRLDTEQVMQQLHKDGYFLQLPPPNTDFLDLNLNQSDGF